MVFLFHIRSASCCNEAFKIATSSAAYLNNYFMLIGTDGVYSYTFEHEKRDDCPVCGGEALDLPISSELTVEQLIEMLVEKQDMQVTCYFIFNSHANTFIPQSNQETIPLDSFSTDLSASSTSARTSHATQPYKESIGACAAWRRGYGDGNHLAFQLVPTDQLHIDSTQHIETLSLSDINLTGYCIPRKS